MARLVAACVLVSLSGAWPGNVRADPVGTTAIAAQPVAGALAEFARQTGLQLIYVAEVARARTSAGAPPGLTPADALAKLLEGTGLGFEYLNPRTVRVFDTATGAPTAQSHAIDAPSKRIGNLSERPGQTKDSGTLADTIITAQRRTESISTVPMSISVVSASDLGQERITNIPDLTRSIPNVSFTTQGGPGLNTLEIRGISSQAGTAVTGVYQDDVSLTTRNLYSQGTAEPRFFDLDRVEVLRGPQGTLYGGGTLGGVIRFIKKQPDLRQFYASAAVDVSDTAHGGSNYNAEAVLNLPFVEGKLALRLGAQEGRDSGYIDQVSPTDLSVIAKGINGNRWTIAKAALRWQITGAWSATPEMFYQKVESNDIDTSYEVVPSFQPVAGQALQPLQISKTVLEPGTDRITIPSLTIEGDVGFANLTLIGSLYQRDFARIQNATFANVPYLATLFPAGSALATGIAALNSVEYVTTQQSQKSFEARLASHPYSRGVGLPVSWVAGAFYLNSTTAVFDNEPIVGISNLFSQLGLDINDPNVFPGSWPGAWGAGDSVWYGHRYYNSSQRAVFGELTYYLRPDVRVTLGLRYESATESFEVDGNYYYNACGRPDAFGYTPGCPLHDNPPESSFNATTPRIAATWDIGESNLAYASVAKGYREGSFNRPVRLDYGVFADLQNLGFCDGSPVGCAAALPKVFPKVLAPDSLWSYELGSKSRLFGNRLSIDASVYLLRWNNTQQNVTLPLTLFDFDINAGHIESYGVELELRARPTRGLALVLAGGYNHAAFSDGVPALGYNNGVLNVAKGAKVPGVPEYNARIGADYSFAYSAGVTGFVRGDVLVVGQSRGAFTLGVPDYYRPGYVTSDASTGLTFGAYEVSLFGKNLSNGQTVFQRPTLNYAVEAYTLRPRTIGLEVQHHFANR